MFNLEGELSSLIGDIDLFKPVLDGFFKGWEGTYDILMYNKRKYIFHPRYVFSNFCQTIRENPEGEELCLNCDQLAAEEALIKNGPIDYICHAGLIDIAAPIIINGKCFATVFCGQRRPLDDEDIKKAHLCLTKTEEKLNISLKEYWNNAVSIKKTEVQSIKDNLTKLTKYLSNQWGEKLELIVNRKKLEYREKESNAVRTAFISLNEISKSEKKFWGKLNYILKRISLQFKADYAVIFILDNNEVILKSCYNLPKSLLDKSFNGDKHLFDTNHPTLKEFDLIDNSISINIIDLYSKSPNKIAVWPFHLNEDKGIFALYLNDSIDNQSNLPITQELNILEPFLGQISMAYSNFKLFEEERRLKNLQGEWLQDVVHEVVQPLNGILGYSERWNSDLKSKLENWENDKNKIDPKYFTDLKNCLESIEWMSINASNVAKNFAWIADEEMKTVVLSKDVDIIGLLIACARDKQGQANTNNIIGPKVLADTFTQYNKRIKVDINLFKQATRNVLDNAVKYASPGTSVIVCGLKQDANLHIRIKNNGKIPLLHGEEKNIFNRKFRTKAAKESGINGSGIGLSISHEILRLHNGNILAYPSKKQNDLYETIFDIVIPLIDEEENNNDK